MKFLETHRPIFDDLSSTDIALRLAGAGFGIVPGTGAWSNGRPVTRKRGEKGSHSSPLYGVGDVMESWLGSDDVQPECPFYLALNVVDDSDRQLTVVDLDNGHSGPSVDVDVLWERWGALLHSLGCPEALSTMCVMTPNQGLHLYFLSKDAKLFKWCPGMRSELLGDEIAVDWLTPTGRQNVTGPGVRRRRADGTIGRYDLYVPMGHDEDTCLGKAVADMPAPLLRWLVAQHIAVHDGRPERCVTSSTSTGRGANLGLRMAQRSDVIGDLMTSRRKSSTVSRGTTSDPTCELGLFRNENVAESGTRHSNLVRFAGTCVSRCTGVDFDSTCAMIRGEIERYASDRCLPPLAPDGDEVVKIIESAMGWADEQRAEIEGRIASRAIIIDPATGDESVVVARGWGLRKIHGGTYRCRLSKSGRPGAPISSPASVAEALEHDDGIGGCFALDQFSQRPMVVRALPWDQPGLAYPRDVMNSDISRAIVHIDEAAGFDPSKSWQTAFTAVCDRHGYDPLTDYLDEIHGRWDGESHIGALLSDWMHPVDDDVDGRSLSAEFMTLWMRQCVRRAYRPGSKADLCVILQGPQGCGKTEFVKHLAMRQDWLCENLGTVDPKLAFESMQGRWIINLDELEGFTSKKDVAKVKAFLTRTHDDYRVPYARTQDRTPRRCCFIGSSNDLAILHDRTGSRRFLVIQCEGVYVSSGGIRIFDEEEKFVHEIEQAWAEAVDLEKRSGFSAPLVLPGWARREQDSRNASYSIQDPWDEEIERFLIDAAPLGEPVCYAQIYATIRGVPEEAYLAEQHLRSFQDTARRVAQRLGWTYGVHRGHWGDPETTSSRRGFKPPRLSADDAAQAAKARQENARKRDRMILDETPWTGLFN